MKRFSLNRYWAIVKKEIIQIRRDKASFAIALGMPIMMIFLFGYAMNTDVSHLKTVIWDQSHSAESREIIANLENTEIYQVNSYANSYQELETVIDKGEADVAVVIPPDYANKRDNNEVVSIQMLINGSDPNVARTAYTNAILIVQNKAMNIQEQLLQKQGMGKMELPLQLETRVLFNPNMESIVFNIPGLIGLIMQNVIMILTAFSMVREKERGTMEQLIVTPIQTLELLLGKITPYIFIGLFSFTIVLSLGVFWFGVPVKGSFLLLVCLSLLFLIATLTLGIMISTISKTQLQAMQLSFAFILPSVLLSGFMFPRDTMPLVIQWIGSIVPLTYFLEILRGIFLKGIGLEALWMNVMGLLVFFMLIISIAMLRFRKRMD
ncbi:ABC transporter permease [Brevibacillus laterosporus]|nr:ABC transporter permease [Brevibacillus laterosporus]TPG70914.1 ABC transporter permease [Brevibacillus laterosporus]